MSDQSSVRRRHLGAVDFTGTAEDLARLYYETFERLAPNFGCGEVMRGRQRWEGAPRRLQALLIAVFEELLFGEAEAVQPSEGAGAEEREGER